MPDNATDTVQNQIQELRKVAAKRLILVVLDGGYSPELLFKSHCRLLISDMWDTEHERPFSCIDPATASKLLVVRAVYGANRRCVFV